MIDNLDRDNIHKYLKGIEVTSLTEQMARGITRSSAEKIVQGLKKGLLHIPKVIIKSFRIRLLCQIKILILPTSPAKRCVSYKTGQSDK
jgi:hypothetical protein